MIYLLIGPIGVGKSTIGQLLAKELNYEFVELDKIALFKSGYDTIQEALQLSPTKFKESELQASKELSTKENVVIACGGAVVLNQLNFDYFKENGKQVEIIYLKTHNQVQFNRLHEKHKFEKGLHNKIQTNIEKTNQEREYLYNFFADKIIDTTEKSLISVVSEAVKK